jgi:hypothetical protein
VPEANRSSSGDTMSGSPRFSLDRSGLNRPLANDGATVPLEQRSAGRSGNRIVSRRSGGVANATDPLREVVSKSFGTRLPSCARLVEVLVPPKPVAFFGHSLERLVPRSLEFGSQRSLLFEHLVNVCGRRQRIGENGPKGNHRNVVARQPDGGSRHEGSTS